MKKDIAIVGKAIAIFFLEGSRKSDIIEGKLVATDSRTQNSTRWDWENMEVHLNITSEIHQKLGTLSW